ncbi:universal stress protein [Aquiflexum lacus]|uniref:universal stress protein n=1 Tax=Aquiflexum lacus TaxID=2483805 RepID=UPI0018940A95|nr:universal stress protein [Aquiflexum lacus]
MKILVPTDFSENANNALEFAKKIAKHKNASITLLYAFYAVYDFASQATEIIGQIEMEAKRELKKATEKGQAEGLRFDYKIIQGTVSTAVTSIALREDYNLIVMGTQGASGIKKALIGSNTGHVIKESKIPVLAVPFNSDWGKENKISVALELEKEDEKYFKKLFSLTEELKLPYEFFHIKTDDNFEKEIEFKGLEVFLREEYPNKDISFTVVYAKEVNKGIQQYLDQNPGAMLVMFSKNKTFFEYIFNKSTSLEMAFHTHVPLLVVK